MNGTPDHHHPEYIRTRIGNACDSCKARKVKCDGRHPCAYCLRRHLAPSCHYSPQKRRNPRAHHDARSPAGSSGPAPKRVNSGPSSPHPASSLPPSSAHPPPTTTSATQDPHGPAAAAPHHHDDETDVPREARLLRDAQGKLVFIGDCAPLSFFQSVRRLVTARVDAQAFAAQVHQPSVLENPARGGRGGGGGGGGLDAQDRGGRRSSTGAALPPHVRVEMVEGCVRRYVTATAGLVDLFDHRVLAEQITVWARTATTAAAAWSGTGAPDADATSIVHYLVLAIGLQETAPDAASTYFAHAQTHALTHLSADPGPSTVQAFILITLYMLRACQLNGAFLFFGLAVRAAYSIGVHRTEVNARCGAEAGRQRDRLWRSLRVVDLYLSTAMGRPPGASDVDCTVAYHAVEERGEEDGGDREAFDLLNASVQIFLVMERIVVEVYSRRRVSLAVTEGISGQLRDWSRTWLGRLKGCLSVTTAAADGGLVSGACRILATYYYSVMLVSRPFLVYELCRRLSEPSTDDLATGTPSASGKSKLADACIDAAHIMVDQISALVTKNVLPRRAPLLVSWLFAASLVLGLGVLGGFGRILEKKAKISVETLEHFATDDTHAKQYARIAQSLLDAALKYVEEKEARERSQRTASSSHLFGLVPAGSADGTGATARGLSAREGTDAPPRVGVATTPTAAAESQGVAAGAPSASFPAAMGLDETPGSIPEFFQTWAEMPDFAMFDGLLQGESGGEFGTQDWSALNLFPLLGEGGHIDLMHDF